MDSTTPFMTIRTRQAAADTGSMSSADSTYGSCSESTPTATHDLSRVSYHVKHLESFAEALQESASRAFPNPTRGQSTQRYSQVHALMLHWECDDLFVLPELEDLEKCFRQNYNFETDIFPIPSENAHLELMLKIGDMLKKHETDDTLFIVYYGGHARIDESRQSTWCATRRPGSPWLQWSAIQTLLERSPSDVLILLDCCAGAASATFPTGQSITETISASTWDAIAPDPGRYSFTNALIEVLQEWRHKTFSAAMLHAEVLARLKHPRPILINGKHFEARSTPVHFMMTSNHKAPSIELGRFKPPARQLPSVPSYLGLPSIEPKSFSRMSWDEDSSYHSDGLLPHTSEPNENEPHVMISLALEEDQRLDLDAWEQWLASFPALAKFVKVQGVFKSHSTLLLLSLPIMVWDLLPDDPACNFIAFIRSNNLLRKPETSKPTGETAAPVKTEEPVGVTPRPGQDERVATPGHIHTARATSVPTQQHEPQSSRWQPDPPRSSISSAVEFTRPDPFASSMSSTRHTEQPVPPSLASASSTSLNVLHRQNTAPPAFPGTSDDTFVRVSDSSMRDSELVNRSQSLRHISYSGNDELEGTQMSKQAVDRLEAYFQQNPEPNEAVVDILSSNLGVETGDIQLWFHNRRQQQMTTRNLELLRLGEHHRQSHESKSSARMILPGHLNTLLEIYPSKGVLIVDLRSSSEFEKSHIHEAINLRAPLSFVQNTSLEMIEDTFVDDQSRRSFSKWAQSRCVVFYDRVIEFDWECPVADALYEKFRRKGWLGQCFILKGHYREFSVSFDKYISGAKMSREAKEYRDGLRQQASPTQDEANLRHERYDAWLGAFESEDRVPTAKLIPSKKLERIRALEQRQKELEAEFESRFPALYKKAQAMRPMSPPPASNTAAGLLQHRESSPMMRSPSSASSPTTPLSPPPPPFSRIPSTSGDRRMWGEHTGSQQQEDIGGPSTAGERRDVLSHNLDDDEQFQRKVALVEPFSRGLDLMRQAAGTATTMTPPPPPPVAPPAPYSDSKLAGDHIQSPSSYHHDEYYDYDEIDPRTEGLRNDPAFQRAGIVGVDAVTGTGAWATAGVGGAGIGGGSPGGSGTGSPGGASGTPDEGVKKGRKRPQLQIWERLRSGGK